MGELRGDVSIFGFGDLVQHLAQRQSSGLLTITQAAMQKMSDDPRMKNMQMPFDGKRMIFGGFENVFELRK